eukprot:PhM_4_TR6111/c0_g1_i1/m.59329
MGGTHLLEVGGEVHGELLDLSVVVRLDVLEQRGVLGGDEVDGNTLAAEATGAANAVEVVLLVRRQVEVDHDGDVVHVDAAGEQVGRDEHTRAASAELLDDLLAVALRHVAVDEAHGVVLLVKLLGEPVDLAARVAEDHGLSDRHGVVQIAQRLELEVLLDGDVVLLDAVEREHLLLDENAARRAHELVRQRQHVLGDGGAEEGDLDVAGEELEDLVDLLREALREHLVGLVEDKDAELVRAEAATLDDVVDTAGRADGDEDALLDLLDVVLHARATDERVAEALAVAHVLADARAHLLRLQGKLAGRRQDEGLAVALREVQTLERGDDEGTGLARTRLGLGDDVTALRERHDGALLDGRRLLETVRVDATEEVVGEAHVVEGGDDLDALGETVVVEGVVVLGLVGGAVLIRHF